MGSEPLPPTAFPRSIDTARLRLCQPERAEEALYTRLAAEAYATRPEPWPVELARAFATFMVEHWSRYGFGFLVIDVIEPSGPARTVGHAGFKYVDAWPNHWAESYDAIELGYALVPSARGFGFASEAARAVLAAAPEAFEVAKVRARCNRDNPDSAGVLLRCGMNEIESPGALRRFEMTLRRGPA